MSQYKAVKKWRKTHTKTRNAYRKKNYDITKNDFAHTQWTHYDFLMMKRAEELQWTDAFLSSYLKRSVQAIQQKRYMLKKGGKK